MEREKHPVASNGNRLSRLWERERDGQTVQHSYDVLNRLIRAETTSSSWGLKFVYDGFGNRTEEA